MRVLFEGPTTSKECQKMVIVGVCKPKFFYHFGFKKCSQRDCDRRIQYEL